MFQEIENNFNKIAPKQEYCSILIIDENCEEIQVRDSKLQPLNWSQSTGAIITVVKDNGFGYASTADLSLHGLEKASANAYKMALLSSKLSVFNSMPIMPKQTGEFTIEVARDWQGVLLKDKIDLLQNEVSLMQKNTNIVSCEASLKYTRVNKLMLTNQGGKASQQLAYLSPSLSATAADKNHQQSRTLGQEYHCQQKGLELLDEIGFIGYGGKLAKEAEILLKSPQCPNGKMDVVLDADQMILQVHESIGHPIELDRILGDERNYAGSSFVTLDMFGKYRYGSKMLNISFDPTIKGEMASYGFDDEGKKSEKIALIKDGILLKPLGSTTSMHRAKMNGALANSRVSSWNRPPIDRMANLNLEPGKSSLDDMISSIDSGVLMKTNSSWSIDDCRNKFQFGCEMGQIIKNGKLTHFVKNPNYRGISSQFWQKLDMVGDNSTFKVLGSAYCGKGEPNQCIHVGHAVPACLFRDIDVFGDSNE